MGVGGALYLIPRSVSVSWVPLQELQEDAHRILIVR